MDPFSFGGYERVCVLWACIHESMFNVRACTCLCSLWLSKNGPVFYLSCE
jgi:hypothetical protein